MPPPAEDGTTQRIGFDGKVCANDAEAAKASAVAMVRTNFKGCSLMWTRAAVEYAMLTPAEECGNCGNGAKTAGGSSSTMRY